MADGFSATDAAGTEVANQALAAYVLDLEMANTDLTTDYLGGNLLSHEHPAVAWLRDCINRTVADYFKKLGMAYTIDCSLQGWANVNRLGDYHDPHNHPHPIGRAPMMGRRRPTARHCAPARMCGRALSPSTIRAGRR